MYAKISRRGILPAITIPLFGAPQTNFSFALVADLHHGLMPDAHARLDAFLGECSARRPEFIAQLGDFCHPQPAAADFLKSWHSYPGRKYSVLGNHDMDFGTKRQIMDRLQMQRSYYSFDAGPFHFCVLDCNSIHTEEGFVDFANGNYFGKANQRDWVDAAQVEWLASDLAATSRPTILLTHQPVQGFWHLPADPRRQNVRDAIAAANRHSPGKVVACFSGHEHVDGYRQVERVHYLIVNSASYYWAGEEYGRLAKYRQPLYLFATLSNGVLRLQGRTSKFIPPDPTERKHPNAHLVTASIQDRTLKLSGPRV